MQIPCQATTSSSKHPKEFMNSLQLDFEEWPYRCDFHIAIRARELSRPGSPNHQQRIETSGKATIVLARQVIHLACWSPKADPATAANGFFCHLRRVCKKLVQASSNSGILVVALESPVQKPLQYRVANFKEPNSPSLTLEPEKGWIFHPAQPQFATSTQCNCSSCCSNANEVEWLKQLLTL